MGDINNHREDSPSPEDAQSVYTHTSFSSTTYKLMDHETLEVFHERFKSLAHDIGAHSLENISRLEGGSFNQIMTADLHRVDGDSEPEKVVIRIPRWYAPEDLPNEDIPLQCAVLKMVVDVGVPAPRVLAYDCTAENAIGRPFMVQSRLPGQKLEDFYKDMSLTERLQIVDEFVHILKGLDQIKFEDSGILKCSAAAAGRTKLGLMSLCQGLSLFRLFRLV